MSVVSGVHRARASIDRPPTYWWLGVLGALVAFDVAVMTAFWALEGNPIVLELGREGHIAAKVVIFGTYALLFHVFRDVTPRTTTASAAVLTALYGVVAATNIAVVVL